MSSKTGESESLQAPPREQWSGQLGFLIAAIGVGLALARIITDHNWRHDVATSGHITLPRTHVEAVE